MQIGMGILEWEPDAFWRSTPHDLFAGLDGWMEKNGVKGGGTDGLSAADVEALQALLDQDQSGATPGSLSSR